MYLKSTGEGKKSWKIDKNQAPVVFPSLCKILKTAKSIDSFETAALYWLKLRIQVLIGV